jgi:hypothetical protein
MLHLLAVLLITYSSFFASILAEDFLLDVGSPPVMCWPFEQDDFEFDENKSMGGFCCGGAIVRAARLLYTGPSSCVSRAAPKDFHFTRPPQFKVEGMTEITPRNIAMAVTHVSESNLDSYSTY